LLVDCLICPQSRLRLAGLPAAGKRQLAEAFSYYHLACFYFESCILRFNIPFRGLGAVWRVCVCVWIFY